MGVQVNQHREDRIMLAAKIILLANGGIFHFPRTSLSTSEGGFSCYSLCLNLEIHGWAKALVVGMWFKIIYLGA